MKSIWLLCVVACVVAPGVVAVRFLGGEVMVGVKLAGMTTISPPSSSFNAVNFYFPLFPSEESGRIDGTEDGEKPSFAFPITFHNWQQRIHSDSSVDDLSQRVTEPAQSIEASVPKNWRREPSGCARHAPAGILGPVTRRQHSRNDRLTRRKRIVGGEHAKPNEFPFLARLVRRGTLFCGAVILNERWALTSAHCFDKVYIWDEFYLIAGASSLLDFNSQVRYVSQIVIHPQYDPVVPVRHHGHDVALLKTNISWDFSQVNFKPSSARPPQVLRPIVQPACLKEPNRANPTFSDGGPLPGATCFVAGWGVTTPGSRRASPIPKFIEATVIDAGECYRADGVKRDGEFVCARGVHRHEDSCYLDSGGPLMCLDEEGRIDSGGRRWYLAGIVTWGRGCAVSAYPGLYTNVAFHRRWIARETATP